MSTKRVKLREMKRKAKQKKQLMLLISVVVALLLVGSITYFSVDAYSKSYVMTFEGKKISVEDFKFCTAFVSGETDGKAESLDYLLKILSVNKAAAENNITLTQDDIDYIDYNADYWKYIYSAYGVPFPNIKDDRLKELLKFEVYYERLLEPYTESYVVDEADFATALADYIENGKLYYIDAQVKSIFTETLAAAEEAHQKLMDGADLDAIIAAYSIYYAADTGVEVNALADFYLETEVSDAVLAMEVGSISPVYTLADDTYAIFIPQSITIPTEEEIAASYREEYILSKKTEMFDAIIETWKASAQYTINQKAYDAAW